MNNTFDDDLYRIRLHEQYQNMLMRWVRTDISIPSFNQWHYAMSVGLQGQRGLHGRLSDVEMFTVIETFILHLSRAKLSLVTDVDSDQESVGFAAKVVVGLFGMEKRFEDKLIELFRHYLEKPQQVFEWKRFGRMPEAQMSMQTVLRSEIARTEDALYNETITFERAMGRIEGATSIMYRSGACDEVTANTIIEDWRGGRKTISQNLKASKEKNAFLNKLGLI